MKPTPMSRPLADVDPQIGNAIDNETRRQHEGLELIASENFVSEAVLEAMGSVFTNKYAEGYPGKRYYGGCEYADVVENLARDRAKQLFGAEHANVQPHARSPTKWARSTLWTWRTSPGWWPAARILRRCRTRILLLPPRTKPCAVRARE